jgi:hypothetical protein
MLSAAKHLDSAPTNEILRGAQDDRIHCLADRLEEEEL